MFVSVVIQWRKIMNNRPGRVLEYCFFSSFLWRCQAKLCKQPHLPVSTLLWSTSSSLLSEFGVQQIPFDQKVRGIWLVPCRPTGVIEHPWILSPDHYLLHFQSTYSLPMMSAGNLTVDDLLNVLLSGPFFAPLFLECWFPKARMLFFCIDLKHRYAFTVMDESLCQKDFRKTLDCCYVHPKPSSGALDLAKNASCVYKYLLHIPCDNLSLLFWKTVWFLRKNSYALTSDLMRGISIRKPKCKCFLQKMPILAIGEEVQVVPVSRLRFTHTFIMGLFTAPIHRVVGTCLN